MLYGYKFILNGKRSPNDIDRLMGESKGEGTPGRRTAGKGVGATLKDDVENLRDLRNASVKPLGYSDTLLNRHLNMACPTMTCAKLLTA
jgi:hypothetical protein